MKVDIFRLALTDASTSEHPRAMRIATVEGVFWLVQDGPAARLVLLPPHVEPAAGAPPGEGSQQPAWLALALAAETEAASRWIRQGTAHHPGEPTSEPVDLDAPS